MTDVKRKSGLGRGLSSLLTFSEAEIHEQPSGLAIEVIVPGRHQPRRSFPEADLQALSASIREKGVLQPILVRAHPENESTYEIIAGERRWRAAKQAGLATIPAIIREFTDAEALEVGLLENIQRQDLNPIEEAEGYHRLAEEFHYTQETLSQILGKSRSHIANTLRLLVLPKTVQAHLISGALTAGHGRTLINAENPEDLAEMILENKLSVRQAESLDKGGTSVKKKNGSSPLADPEKEILEKHLSDLLGVPVSLTLKGEGGKVTIPFKTPSDLDGLIQKLNNSGAEKAKQFVPKVWVS